MLVRTASAAFALVAFAAPASAQREVTLASTSLEYTPSAEVKDASSDAEFSSVRTTVGVLVPIPLGRRTTLLLAPRYRTWNYSGDGAAGAQDTRVHDIGFLATVYRRLSKSWSLASTIGVGLATDFDDVDGGDVRVTGAISAERVFGPRLRAGVGLAGSYVFGDLLPVPLLLFDWLPTDRVHVVGVLPQRLRARFRLAPWLLLGAGADVDGNRFSARIAAPEVSSIALSRGTVQVRGSARLFDKLWLVLYAGHTVFRRLKAFDDDGTELADLTLQQSPLVGFAVEFRVPLRPAR